MSAEVFDLGGCKMAKIQRTDEQWAEQLDAEQFRVCREKGTEPAFSGKYWDSKDSGVYRCVACGEALFASTTKYDSGCGWPSFYAPMDAEGVTELADDSLGMRRTEVICKQCDSHLGHVFPDGPPETGLRYCINSASLKLDKDTD
jgi:peptide-methionine (R)-S-oxide reductase